MNERRKISPPLEFTTSMGEDEAVARMLVAMQVEGVSFRIRYTDDS